MELETRKPDSILYAAYYYYINILVLCPNPLDGKKHWFQMLCVSLRRLPAHPIRCELRYHVTLALCSFGASALLDPLQP